MSLTIVTDPTRTVNGILSNVVAFQSQIPFTFKRVDLSGKSLVLSPTGGKMAINFEVGDGSDLEFSEIGDLIYLIFADTYETKIYEVELVDSPFGPPFGAVVFTESYISDTLCDANLLSSRKNYNTYINIFSEDSNGFLLNTPIRYRPKTDGTLFVDLSGLFFGATNAKSSLNFHLVYGESYNGQDQPSIISPTYLGLPAVKQIMNDGGSNMWEFLPSVRDEMNVVEVVQNGNEGNLFIRMDVDNTIFNVNDYITLNAGVYKVTCQIIEVSLGVDDWIKIGAPYLGDVIAGVGKTVGTLYRPAGQFLTSFKELTQWVNFTRDLSFIVDDNLLTRTGASSVNLSIDSFDESGVLITNTITNYTEIGVNKFTFPVTDVVSYYKATLLGGGGGTTPISETKKVNQVKACKNPMLIEWENSHGGKEQHVFDTIQLVEDTSSEGLLIEKAIDQTIDAVSDTISRLPVRNNQMITLTTEKISLDSFKALRYIKKSQRVSLYLDSVGRKKISVAITGSYNSQYQTSDILTDFSMKIMLPTNFDINDSWQ